MDWNAELAPEERDRMIEWVAHQVARRQLEVPATLFLEMHRPLTFLTSQSLVVASPMLAVIVGPERVQQVVKLLEDRGNLDRLVDRIAEMAAERGDDARPPSPQKGAADE